MFLGFYFSLQSVYLTASAVLEFVCWASVLLLKTNRIYSSLSQVALASEEGEYSNDTLALFTENSRGFGAAHWANRDCAGYILIELSQPALFRLRLSIPSTL